jgi:pimeloyl-ACP methyl ester carboxylesterase
MTTYCLMHGSGQGAGGWKLLVEQLQQRGHDVITPSFQIERTEEGARYHAGTIVEALNDSGVNRDDVIIVAHSAGGMYLPIVAEMWRPRQMVFLAGVIPVPGVSVIEQAQADHTMFNREWAGKNPKDDQVAIDSVFHDCPPDRLEWALSTRIFFFAKAVIQEKCPLETWPEVPASYIACADDRTITPEWQVRAARERLGVEAIVLPGGHAPFVSRPEELADVLTANGLSNK